MQIFYFLLIYLSLNSNLAIVTVWEVGGELGREGGSGVFRDFPSQEKQMLGPQIFDWADRANNVFLARSYVFSFVARCDPPFWTGNGCAGVRGRQRKERRERWKAKSELRLGCLPINLLLLTTTSVMKCKQHQSQILSPPCSAPPPSSLLPPPMTGALLPSSALTVLGYSFWCCCCCCCLACLVSGLVCLHSEANPSTQLNPGTNATSPRPERENVVGEREFGAALSPLTCGHYKNQWINIYMPKYLTTKKKQMYNGPPLLNAYLSRGVSTEEGKRGSCQGPGASPVCTYTLDYWYVFQSPPPPPLPTPSLIHCKFAFYANDFSLRFSYVFSLFSHSFFFSLFLAVWH